MAPVKVPPAMTDCYLKLHPFLLLLHKQLQYVEESKKKCTASLSALHPRSIAAVSCRGFPDMRIPSYLQQYM